MLQSTNPLVTARVEVAISIQTLASILITCALIFLTYFALRKLISQ